MSTVALKHANFEEHANRQGIVLVDFWAEWCGPCRAFAPIFEKASEKHPDVTFGKVNTDEEQELAARFAIRAIPTLMAFRDGILLFQQPGLLAPPMLDALIAELGKLDMNALRQAADEQEGTGDDAWTR